MLLKTIVTAKLAIDTSHQHNTLKRGDSNILGIEFRRSETSGTSYIYQTYYFILLAKEMQLVYITH